MTNMSSFCLIQADKDSIVEFGDFPCSTYRRSIRATGMSISDKFSRQSIL